MERILDLAAFPIDNPEAKARHALIERCRGDLARDGMFNLPGFVRPEICAEIARALAPVFDQGAFTHARRHNIYFKPHVDGLAPDHPALAEFETINHTICADQMGGSTVLDIYEYPPLADLLAEAMGKPALHTMADPLARVNVMRYEAGEALNWHFDRSEFTTTLLLQAPDQGGAFEYARDLRTDDDPRYDDVARLIAGDWPVEQISLSPGTLNIFKGKNTAHRVTPVHGDTPRMIAVFSYYEAPGVMFSDDERIGFYGRAA